MGDREAGGVIRIVCDRCDRVLEVDASRAGEKVECPDCGDVNIVPRVTGSPARLADDAGSREVGSDATGAPGPDRAVDAGLPPDTGPEQRVMRVRPAVLRSRPLAASGILLLLLGGLVSLVWILFVPMAWLGALGGLAATVALGVLLWWWVLSLGASLEISNKRTVLRLGLLSRSTSEVVHDNIRNVQIDQTFVQRVFGTGSIGISSSGQDGIEIELRGIPSPERVRRVIDLYRPL